jgi:hypothetical protein
MSSGDGAHIRDLLRRPAPMNLMLLLVLAFVLFALLLMALGNAD